MADFCTYKRWRLREGVGTADVAALVGQEIVPHYRRLDARVVLTLERVCGSPELIAVQHWPSRTLREQVMGGPAFEAWWVDYVPVLERFDQLVELVEEWETEVVPLWSSS